MSIMILTGQRKTFAPTEMCIGGRVTSLNPACYTYIVFSGFSDATGELQTYLVKPHENFS
jgi:hypothetical protein